jgi:hypothetical protein
MRATSILTDQVDSPTIDSRYVRSSIDWALTSRFRLITELARFPRIERFVVDRTRLVCLAVSTSGRLIHLTPIV